MVSDLSKYGIALPAYPKPARRPAAQTKAKPRRNPERDAQRTVVKYLRAVLPSGSIVQCVKNEAQPKSHDPIARAAFHNKRKGDGFNWGFPDLIVLLPEGRTLLIEMKSAKGTPTENQDEMHARLRLLKHPIGVARSISDVRIILAGAGIRTKEAA